MKLRLALSLLLASACWGQQQLRVIMFGAHPDDCDIKSGGTAVKFARAGHKVKFVSVTNGNAGHQSMGGGILAKRRYAETQESMRRTGIAEYQVLDNDDGELLPTLEVRKQIIRAIREWKADIVIAPRPNDYHPDHRYTGVLIQDAAYMVVVPNVVADVEPLHNNPVFLYYNDNFQKPSPFRHDVVVAIDDVWQTKLEAFDAHESQFYEWLPWVDHLLQDVPKDKAARRKWLETWMNKSWSQPVSAEQRAVLEKRYGKDAAAKVVRAESFELCEYGRRPKLEDLWKMFPK
ncbi:MAG: PIG-L family deacetylase [Bryobacterales bacterium]|nr:PIG-L family deacetylase [Bryobacterales bacterium]